MTWVFYHKCEAHRLLDGLPCYLLSLQAVKPLNHSSDFSLGQPFISYEVEATTLLPSQRLSFFRYSLMFNAFAQHHDSVLGLLPLFHGVTIFAESSQRLYRFHSLRNLCPRRAFIGSTQVIGAKRLEKKLQDCR